MLCGVYACWIYNEQHSLRTWLSSSSSRCSRWLSRVRASASTAEDATRISMDRKRTLQSSFSCAALSCSLQTRDPQPTGEHLLCPVSAGLKLRPLRSSAQLFAQSVHSACNGVQMLLQSVLRSSDALIPHAHASMNRQRRTIRRRRSIPTEICCCWVSLLPQSHWKAWRSTSYTCVRFNVF